MASDDEFDAAWEAWATLTGALGTEHNEAIEHVESAMRACWRALKDARAQAAVSRRRERALEREAMRAVMLLDTGEYAPVESMREASRALCAVLPPPPWPPFAATKEDADG